MDFLTSPVGIRTAVIAWIIYGVALATVTAIQPDRRTVTPNYRQAAVKWWKGEEDIYFNKKKGFLYFPQCAIVYTPFTLPPKRIGEPLWRLVSLGALVFGLWRVAGLLRDEFRGRNGFGIFTALTIPASFASAGNGQVNVILSALFLHVAVDLARGRNIFAALWLGLSLAFKPLALVYILLAGALYPRLRLPLFLSLLVVVVLPFLHPNWDYVLRQLQLCKETVLSASQPDYHDFCDLSGMFLTFGIQLPGAFWTGVRLVMAVLTLGVCWLALRREGILWGSLHVLAFCALYLMLMNPRTEANSYILLAPSAAVFAVREYLQRERMRGAATLAFYCISLGCDSYGILHRWTNLWYKALASSVFAGWLVRGVFCVDRRAPSHDEKR